MQQESSNPTAPASGKWKFFFKSDGLYVEKSDGTVTGPLSTGGGGTWGSITGTLSSQTDLKYALNPQQGFLINGKISPTVASNNLTLAIKTMAGNDPSASEPVYVRIADTLRSITAALSVTKNAGTNWFNAGGSELATKEIDYFAYLGYNATDGVTLGFARIPYGRQYSDFSATSTNEKYCAISTITNAAAGDYYENIGRFAATLSAGAGYTWTVPTYTAVNLVSKPTTETRWLSWTPAYAASGSMTYTSVSTDFAKYKVSNQRVLIEHRSIGTTGGTGSNEIYATLPFESANSANTPPIGGALIAPAGALVFGGAYIKNATPDQIVYMRYDYGNWGLGANSIAETAGFYEI